MRIILGALIIFILVTTQTSADWNLDFVRYQCIPEMGALQIESLSCSNPDRYGFFEYLAPKEAKTYDEEIRRFEQRNNIYLIRNSRSFNCVLGSHRLNLRFHCATNSQGQQVCSMHLSDGNKVLLEDVPINSYNPQVNRLSIDTSEDSLSAAFEILTRDSKIVNYTTILGRKIINAGAIERIADKSSNACSVEREK